MRFDQPYDVQQVFLAFAGAAFPVLPGENLSTQRVRQARPAQSPRDRHCPERSAGLKSPYRLSDGAELTPIDENLVWARPLVLALRG